MIYDAALVVLHHSEIWACIQDAHPKSLPMQGMKKSSTWLRFDESNQQQDAENTHNLNDHSPPF